MPPRPQCAAEEAAKVSLSQRQDVVRCRAAEDAECGSAPIPGRLPGCTASAVL